MYCKMYINLLYKCTVCVCVYVHSCISLYKNGSFYFIHFLFRLFPDFDNAIFVYMLEYGKCN